MLFWTIQPVHPTTRIARPPDHPSAPFPTPFLAATAIPHAACGCLIALCRIRARGDHLRRPGGHRIRGMGIDRSPAIDCVRLIFSPATRVTPTKNFPGSRWRFGPLTEPVWPAAGSSHRGRSSRARPRSLLHGFAEASSALEARRAAALNRHGWNVAVLDSRGYGQSDGPFSTFGGREAGDIRTWLTSSPSGPRRSTRNCHSARCSGAVRWERPLPLRTAAAEAPLAALVLESPMVDLECPWPLCSSRRMIPFPKLMARLVTRRAGRLAGVPIHAPRPIDSARQVTCPTLILHGTNDTVVSIDEARRLADAFPARLAGSKLPTHATPTSSIKGATSSSIRSRRFSMKPANSAVAARMQMPGAS